MPRTTSVTIGSQLDKFIGELIKSGRYGSTSEVVRTALRLLEHQEHQVAALRNAVAAGERSGESETNYWTGTLYLTCDLPWGSVPV